MAFQFPCFQALVGKNLRANNTLRTRLIIYKNTCKTNLYKFFAVIPFVRLFGRALISLIEDAKIFVGSSSFCALSFLKFSIFSIERFLVLVFFSNHLFNIIGE